MKKIYSFSALLMMCLMLLIPAAMAEEMTPTKRFRQQFVVGGNGMRGTVALTASGVAEWLNILMPFTAAKLQVRAIGEAQGDLSDMVTDDDDWQIKFYVEAPGEMGCPKCYKSACATADKKVDAIAKSLGI